MGNICKFIDSERNLELSTERFILETDPGSLVYPQTPRQNVMYLCSEGSGVYELGGRSFPIRSGSLFFGFTGAQCSIKDVGDLEFMYIGFSGSRSAELFARFSVSEENCVFGGFEGLVPLWKESLLKSDKNNIDLVSESVLLLSFSRLKGFGGVRTDAVSAAMKFLDENYSDPELNLARTASALGYNEKYLSHCFSKSLGNTFSEYLKLLRIRQAVFLMENGVSTVKNLAYLVGYRDPLYFSRVFTSVTGKNPRRYLREL